MQFCGRAQVADTCSPGGVPRWRSPSSAEPGALPGTAGRHPRPPPLPGRLQGAAARGAASAASAVRSSALGGAPDSIDRQRLPPPARHSSPKVSAKPRTLYVGCIVFLPVSVWFCTQFISHVPSFKTTTLPCGRGPGLTNLKYSILGSGLIPSKFEPSIFTSNSFGKLCICGCKSWKTLPSLRNQETNTAMGSLNVQG